MSDEKHKKFMDECYTPNQQNIQCTVKQILGYSNRFYVKDVMHQIFVNALKGYASFEKRSSEYTWLFKIAQNTSLTFLRQQKVRGFEITIHELTDGGQTPFFLQDDHWTRNPFAKTYSHELRKVLDMAFQKLSPVSRQFLTLRLVHGLRHKEIAKIMGTTEETAKNYTFRGRRQLMESLRGAGISV